MVFVEGELRLTGAQESLVEDGLRQQQMQHLMPLMMLSMSMLLMVPECSTLLWGEHSI